MLKARGLIVAVAFFLAASATLVLYMYVKGVQQNAAGGGGNVAVIVSEQDIPVGTLLDDLIAEGALKTMTLPENVVVRGAVTSLEELKGRETSAPILAEEQISTTRLRGSEQLPGGTLGIPEGHVSVTLPLESPRLAGGLLSHGDHVTVYGSFEADAGAPKFTKVLVADAEVLRVAKPTATGSGGSSNSTQVWLALKDAEPGKVIFAQERGSVWLSLLPPNEEGQDQPATTTAKVFR